MGKRSERLRRWAAGALMLAAAGLLALSAGAQAQTELAGQVVRLHILAHSDSDGDQALKLRVRDAVLAQAQPLLEGADSLAEAEARLSGHMEEFLRAGEAAVAEAGYDYPVRAELTVGYFPTRTYADFALPAGYYRTLRVEIGAAGGHNWWCVVYPPLCSAGVTEAEQTALGLNAEEIALITQESTEYVLRFQCAEWWGELMGMLSGAETG